MIDLKSDEKLHISEGFILMSTDFYEGTILPCRRWRLDAIKDVVHISDGVSIAMRSGLLETTVATAEFPRVDIIFTNGENLMVGVNHHEYAVLREAVSNKNKHLGDASIVFEPSRSDMISTLSKRKSGQIGGGVKLALGAILALGVWYITFLFVDPMTLENSSDHYSLIDNDHFLNELNSMMPFLLTCMAAGFIVPGVFLIWKAKKDSLEAFLLNESERKAFNSAC